MRVDFLMSKVRESTPSDLYGPPDLQFKNDREEG